MTEPPQIHYVMLPTVDAEGKATGSLQIPILVRAEKPPGPIGELKAEMDPNTLFWFSDAVQKAAVAAKYPGLAGLLGDVL